MSLSKEELLSELTIPELPRSNAYDPEWVLANLMGPNVLWLTELLSHKLELRPGMRVLDMGCGKAVSSIFLAKEFGVNVWAVDLQVPPTDNWVRAREADVEEHVFPLQLDAHALPFADGFFDAAVSLDAYHYFGTSDLYTGYYARFVRPGGQVGIVSPGLSREFDHDAVPSHLLAHSASGFHSPAWWRRHWTRSGILEVECADMVPNGAHLWLKWLLVCARGNYPTSAEDEAMLRIDEGRHLGFARVVGRHRSQGS